MPIRPLIEVDAVSAGSESFRCITSSRWQGDVDGLAVLQQRLRDHRLLRDDSTRPPAADKRGAGICAIQDGVRPFVSADEIKRTVEAAREHGAAILVAPATDTIKQVSGGMVERTVPRNRLRRALTPQCFRYSLLDRVYQEVDVLDPEITDESMLCEKLGIPVAVVEGSARNIKITQPEDLSIAEMLMR